MSAPLVRIGELARRAGIPAATLRAWERRYGIVEPTRTEAGYRLYSEADEHRLKQMIELITQGAAPAEAADRVLRGPPAPGPGAGAGAEDPAALRDELLERLVEFDETGAQAALDRAIAAFGIDTLLGEVLIPVLRHIGARWRRGAVTVSQEHFVSNLLRGRMLALGRGWGTGAGPLALLACPPGEAHDLGLISFGLALAQRGWRIAFLGADTPLEDLGADARRLAPARVVIPVTSPRSAEALAELAPLELGAPLAIGGSEAGPELAEALGAELLAGDVVAAAAQLAATVRPS